MAMAMTILSLVLLLQYPSMALPKAMPSSPSLNPSEFMQGQTKTGVVATKYGRVQGFVTRVGRDAEEQRHARVYLGVPYASPPTGNYRFSPTRPPVHWAGVRSALRFGPACPQKYPKGILNKTADDEFILGRMSGRRVTYLRETAYKLRRQSEDCLYLNLYAPIEDQDAEAPERGYPIIVFIHGGSFEWGSGNLFDGRVLASYGKVLVVTFNYRLGILGFLNTNASPPRRGKPRMANYGLMDQIALLKWLQENAARFGGDPGKVTLFGHESGAVSAHLLMQSPAVPPGLFHRVILTSGSALSSWAVVEDPVYYAVQLASRLNCSIPRNMMEEHESILKCLKAKSVEELTSFHFETPSFLASMGPSRDGILIPSAEQQQQQQPQQHNNDFAGRMKKEAGAYQVMLGLAEDEATSIYFADEEVRAGLAPRDRDRYLRTLVRNLFSFHLNEIFATVQNEYGGGGDFLERGWRGERRPRPKRHQWEAARALTDKLVLAPMLDTADWCNQSGFPTFFYIYGHADKNFLDQEHFDPSSSSDVIPRSLHGSLVPLAFGLPLAPELQQHRGRQRQDEAEPLIAQRIITYWANFAGSGSPSKPNSVSSLFPRTAATMETAMRQTDVWPEYDSSGQKYIKIDLFPRSDSHFRVHAMSIWRNLIPKLHSAGAADIFPRHNALRGHDDPALFAGVVRPLAVFAHGYQANRGSVTSMPPPTTCGPVGGPGADDGSRRSDDDSGDSGLVRWEIASERAYRQAMYLTIGLGALLFAINVWFLACLFFCRSRLNCCLGANVPTQGSLPPGHGHHPGLGPKEYTCETDLGGQCGDESVQSFREIPREDLCSNNRRVEQQQQQQQQQLHHPPEETLRLLHAAVSHSNRGGGSSGSDSERSDLQQQQMQQRPQIAYTVASGSLPRSKQQQQRPANLQHTLDHSCRLSRSPSGQQSSTMKQRPSFDSKLSTFKTFSEAEEEVENLSSNSHSQVVSFGGETILQ